MKFKIATVLLTSALLFSPLSNQKMDAAEIDQTLNFLPIKASTDSISLEWNKAGSFYELYKNENLIYKGTNNNFTDINLESNHPYQYYLRAKDNRGNDLDVAKIKSSTLKENGNGSKRMVSEDGIAASNSFENLRIDTISKNNEIKLDWTDIDGVYEYTVFKNDKQIGKTNESNWIDYIDSSQKQVYKMIGKRKLTYDEKLKRSNQLKGTVTEDVYNSDISPITDEVIYELTKIVEPYKTELQSLKASAVSLNYTIRYQTFIGEDYVEAPADTQNRWLRGNNRGYDPDANYNTKTNSDAFVCFCKPSDVTFYKFVGATDVYTKVNGELQYLTTDQASTDGITMKNLEKTSGHIAFQIYHDVGIPIKVRNISPPHINVELAADFWSDGTYKFAGWHDAAPNHEFYLRENGKWATLHRADKIDFIYLAPPTTDIFFHAEK
ncbi:DUF3238 domain-containing protein [Paenibacillus herberti]|uniref:Fibronectin type-III domain-containing protein n=1 Tax=Paenibacillus herberti TaxID=1619309 RepID=A0A229NXT8_9BACL|nr:DUF3238 domain-containing protein [Paenibacillus herberti]OXM14826.1 hypothetical protein CGZ75_18325 [Paenibacillus herberti]